MSTHQRISVTNFAAIAVQMTIRGTHGWPVAGLRYYGKPIDYGQNGSRHLSGLSGVQNGAHDA